MFTFPNPVNEKAARVVAGGVLGMSIVVLALSVGVSHTSLWLTVVLAYGFVARVLTGPTLSPLGQAATRVVAPRLGESKPVAGPPKRFAQAIGAAVTISALLVFVFGHATVAEVLLGVMILASGLESIFAFCVGCAVFAVLMRVGWIPAATCEACNNLSLRPTALAE